MMKIIFSKIIIFLLLTLLQIIPYTTVAQITTKIVEKNGKLGLIDENNTMITGYHYDKIFSFNDGLALVKRNNLYGYIDTRGIERISCQYFDAFDFSSNRAIVMTEKNKYQAIDTEGKIITSDVYEDLYSFSEGRAVAKRNKLYGYIDTNGREVIPCRYQNASKFVKGYAVVARHNPEPGSGNHKSYPGKYILINTNEDTIKIFNYRHMEMYYQEGMMRVEVEVYSNKKDYRICYGFIDQYFNNIIPAVYEDASDFSEGLCAVKINNHYGYIGLSNQMIIPPKYDIAGDFSEGRAEVILNNEKFFIDPSGNRLFN